MKLNSIILIPFISLSNFLNLKYKDIRPNEIKLEKNVEISVNKSASPLFYQLPVSRKISSLRIAGNIDIKKAIVINENDSYFQLGIIYEGDYRPNGFVKKFLPEWIVSVLNLSPDKGLSEIEFLEVSDGRIIDKKDNIRDIDLVFKNVAKIENGKFSFEYTPKDKKILGFWFRSDGDDSEAKFNLRIEKFEIF